MKHFGFYCIIFVFFLSLFGACSTEIELNAPPKDIWIVYSILNANDSAQYVRISRAFLPESNALEYAKEFDESVKGLQVSLEGAGKEYLAIQMDSVPKNPLDGTFYPYTTLYRFETSGSNQLVPGERYDLTVRQPGTDTFQLHSYTYVPELLRFDIPRLVSGAGQDKCLRKVDLDKDYKVEFRRGNAAAYELRAFLDYTVDNVPMSASFGPTNMFADGFRCVASSSSMCYNFPAKEILTSFYNQVNPDPTKTYRYAVNEDTECEPVIEDIPDAFRFEVTAIDTFLSLYNQVNSPAFTDFNTVRPEYTNIEGSTEALGIFGSISISKESAKLGQCSLFLLRLNGTPPPDSPCNLD